MRKIQTHIRKINLDILWTSLHILHQLSTNTVTSRFSAPRNKMKSLSSTAAMPTMMLRGQPKSRKSVSTAWDDQKGSSQGRPTAAAQNIKTSPYRNQHTKWEDLWSRLFVEGLHHVAPRNPTITSGEVEAATPNPSRVAQSAGSLGTDADVKPWRGEYQKPLESGDAKSATNKLQSSSILFKLLDFISFRSWKLPSYES